MSKERQQAITILQEFCDDLNEELNPDNRDFSVEKFVDGHVVDAALIVLSVVDKNKKGEWTISNGRWNTSEEMRELCAVVERLIRDSAHDLIAGRADKVAGLIIAQLAHKHGMAPINV